MIEEILDKLDILITLRGPNCVYASTEYRGGNSNSGLLINPNGWCLDQIEGRWLHITEVAAIKLDISIEKARELLGSDVVIEHEPPEAEIKMTKTLSADFLKDLVPSFKFYTDKGISKDTLMFFRAGLSMDGPNYGRIVFPIFHKSGQIRGTAARCVLKTHEESRKNNPNYSRPKWKNMCPKSNWDYPFFFLKDYILKSREIILVESLGDMISLFDAGIKNVLVLFGVTLSNEVLSTIIASNPKRILLALNNDVDKNRNRGQEGSIKVKNKLKQFFSSDKIVDAPPESGDFGDLSNNKPAIHEWAAKYNVEIEA